MENIVFYLKLMRGVRGVPLAYVVKHHVKVVHILPGHDAFLNLEEQMIARIPKVDAKLNFKTTQEALDRVYLEYQCDTLKVDNALVYLIFSKMFTDNDTYVYMKKKKSMQDGPVVYFDIHKRFFGHGHVAMQAAEYSFVAFLTTV